MKIVLAGRGPIRCPLCGHGAGSLNHERTCPIQLAEDRVEQMDRLALRVHGEPLVRPITGAEAVRLPGKETAIVFWAKDGTADAIYE
jgi:hypothetical protein